jgi:hypothetical protein
MIATKIFYFCLMSVISVSTVSVNSDLAQREALIEMFLAKIEEGVDWAGAYDYYTRNEEVVDTYFRDSVKRLGDGIENYINPLNVAANGDEDFERPPHPLDVALDGFPQLLFLIKYYNLRILNDLPQQSSGLPTQHPLLALITDAYVNHVPKQYHSLMQQIMDGVIEGYSYEYYTLEVAILFSMNKAMIAIRSPSEVPSRLQDYQNMIQSLHLNLARFLQFTTNDVYSRKVQILEDDINELKRSNIHGYSNSSIQTQVHNLAYQILWVIVIYGPAGLPEAGTEMFSTLLDNDQAVRSILKVDSKGYSNAEIFCQELMESLRTAVQRITEGFPARYTWFNKLLLMVERIEELGNSN